MTNSCKKATPGKSRTMYENALCCSLNLKDIPFELCIICTKVAALLLQFLDRKPTEEPVLTVEEEASEYEA
jgi:hypothetical protein